MLQQMVSYNNFKETEMEPKPMHKTKISLWVRYSNSEFDAEYRSFVFDVEERDKSFMNPQSMHISDDCRAAITAFVETQKDSISGYELDQTEIESIDGSLSSEGAL